MIFYNLYGIPSAILLSRINDKNVHFIMFSHNIRIKTCLMMTFFINYIKYINANYIMLHFLTLYKVE